MFQQLASKFRRITTNQLYLPEIDGLRFLAITIVVLFHTHGYFIGKSADMYAGDSGTATLLDTFLENGGRGVELFFVLSGFILCLPFAHHYINHGKRPHLGRYYLRRVTRLEPPYIIAMTGILLMHLGMHITPAGVIVPSWGASLVYMHGLIYHHTPLLTVVAWSLEIEIQFYLLAPILFSMLGLPAAVRRTILVAATAALIVCQQYYQPPFATIYSFAQFFFIGVLLADLYVSDTAAAFFNSKAMPFAALALLIVIFFLPVREEPGTERLLTARLLFPFIIGAFYYIVLKNDAIKKIFSYRFVPIIGGMCYSIYLLHYTIISLAGRFTMLLHTGHYLPDLFLQIVLICIPVLVISSVFYYYVERPFMAGKWVNMLLKKEKKEEEMNSVQ